MQRKGFSAPDSSWFKGESIEFVKKIVSNPKSPFFEYLDFYSVQDLFSEHISGKQNRRLLIWSLINVNEYISQIMGRS